jgi:hypothetical protein
MMSAGLLDPTAKYRFLRENLAFKQIWMYYLAMVIDPILRFNWILYAIYGNDVQHSAILSFMVALSEVLRRGMWTIFRVENEHCTNVGRFRASRDVPLPYHLESSEIPRISEEGPQPGNSDEEEQRHGVSPLMTVPSRTSGANISRTRTHASESSTLRRRKQNTPSPLMRGLSRVGSILHMAHSQDFERKRKPNGSEGKDEDEDGSSDEDQDNAEEEEVEAEVAAATSNNRDGQNDDTAVEGEDNAENEDDTPGNDAPLWATSSERLRSESRPSSYKPSDNKLLDKK